MTHRRVLSALAAGASLVLVTWVCVLAQTPRGTAGKKPPSPGTRFPSQSADVAPVLSPNRYPPNPYPVQPAYRYQAIPGTLAPPGVSGAPVASLPARLELASGLTIEGQVLAEQLPCQTTFGEVSIPLAKVRGLRLHDSQPSTDPPSEDRAATIVLDNNDSLTVTLRAALIHVKTEWGMAIVDVPHVRSLVLTTDEVQWQEAGGRWILTPIERPAAETEDTPIGTISGRIIIQEEDEAKLGIELEP